jgi:hypothetical protein
MLRDALQERGMSAGSSACLDTETLAAWADGTLSRKLRAAAESHVADCGRCQALLAAMARSEPAAPASWRTRVAQSGIQSAIQSAIRPSARSGRPEPVEGRNPQSAMPWLLLPLTAAVVAVAWLNVTTLRRGAPTSGTSAPAAPLAVASTPSAPPERSDPAGLAARTGAQVDQFARAEPSPPARESQSFASNARRRDAADPRARAGTVEQRQQTSPPTNRDARNESAVAPPPAASPIATPPPPPAPIAEPNAAPSAPAAEPSVFRRGVPPSGSAAAADVAGFGPARAPALAMKMAATPSPIVSPDVNTQWRIVPNGGVERSTDRGATWQQQSTGVTVTLSAGVAPSSKVCWLVGPAGIVVRSTDGGTWQRVAFPEAIDLASIRATDDMHAVVTAADGRTFTTADGGRTWTR